TPECLPRGMVFSAVSSANGPAAPVSWLWSSSASRHRNRTLRSPPARTIAGSPSCCDGRVNGSPSPTGPRSSSPPRHGAERRRTRGELVDDDLRLELRLGHPRTRHLDPWSLNDRPDPRPT